MRIVIMCRVHEYLPQINMSTNGNVPNKVEPELMYYLDPKPPTVRNSSSVMGWTKLDLINCIYIYIYIYI